MAEVTVIHAEEEQDNGFADLAETDINVEDGPQDQEYVELTDAQKMIILDEAVTRHPRHREILYKILVYCFEERELHDVENQIATFPEFQYTTQNQYHLITELVNAFGLEMIERDEMGAQVFESMKEGLTEDEIDDLVVSYSYLTTDLGREYVEIHAPKARIIELLDLDPSRSEAYAQLLQFIGEKTRTYVEINMYLKGHPALEKVIDGNQTTMQPSVFVDKLERAGALVWNEGWELTEEGRAFLDELEEISTNNE